MAPTRMPEAVIGLDVGKSSHRACVATRDGEVLLSAPVANREGDLDSLFGRFPDALVVVDQLFVASKMLTKRHVAFEHFGRHVLHCFLPFRASRRHPCGGLPR